MVKVSQFVILITLLFISGVGCLSFGKYNINGIAYQKFPYKASSERVAILERTFSELGINNSFSDFEKILGEPDMELFGSDEYFEAEGIHRTYIYYIEDTTETDYSYRIYLDRRSQLIGIIIIKLKR